MSISLDFETEVKQFINVGLGVHTKVIINFLSEKRIDFDMSD
jgi:hypothetical protein